MRWDIQFFKIIFPSVLFNINDESIHLTFDDGPHPLATPVILQKLKERNIRGTFFLLGQNAQKYPDLVRQISAEGHQIGNHSYSHTNILFKDKSFLRDEILRTKEILENAVGEHSPYFRPPYGYFSWTTLSVLRELKKECVLWDIDSKDYKLSSIQDISNRVVPNTRKGSILLFHDNNSTSSRVQDYLPALLDVFLAKGFNFKTLPA
ncbi:MAG: polysaccharide deacetylase family protein [Ignavibacteriae bacterium]|nr:MAG: polysaccharide deacetylase family protein [Ignavibacteriota bacterium]